MSESVDLYLQQETLLVKFYSISKILSTQKGQVLKHFTIFSIHLLFFATQINATDYSQAFKKEMEETATTVAGKFEKNTITLAQDYQKCSNAIIPPLCYQLVLNDIRNEQGKTFKATKNCFVACIGIATVETATSKAKCVSGVVGAINIPVSLSLIALIADYIGLWVLESKVSNNR